MVQATICRHEAAVMDSDLVFAADEVGEIGDGEYYPAEAVRRRILHEWAKGSPVHPHPHPKSDTSETCSPQPDPPECVKEVRSGKIHPHGKGGFSLAIKRAKTDRHIQKHRYLFVERSRRSKVS